ncbi:hypothetical protein [Alloalcanivorax mobilis]|uniref:hypothetical protein n=1 Tax=Alloalcanivorax mobilis TaxID=2019569 RepID=UPI000B5B3E59|nr:hypothetical protein [Alloalcanivorax mobilis]ASK35346.1 hypothetical protein CEK62_13630 [Alcanivorax sp. N3-2A]|tara:strand:- start:34752 stop:35090 length:339 start_codon:yes stop_codon:yes gene_type:complete
MYEVHAFVAYGEAREGNKPDFPIGERHAIIVFCRHPINSGHDYSRLEAIALYNGWGALEVAHGGVIVPERLNGALANLQDCFIQAMEQGGAVMPFRDWVRGEDSGSPASSFD